MKAISVLCNHCGAPLEIAEGVRFATCSHCGTHLKLQRKGGAAFTEVLEDIDARTRQIAEDVNALKVYEEVERIDREWELEKDEYLMSGNDGKKINPSEAVAGGVIAMVAGVIFVMLFLRMGTPRLMAAFPLLFVGIGVYYIINGIRKRDGLSEARRQYESRRNEVLDKLDD